MIQKSTAYVVGDKVYASLEEAQIMEVGSLCGLDEDGSRAVVKAKDKLIPVLRMTARSRTLAPQTPKPARAKTHRAAVSVNPNQPS